MSKKIWIAGGLALVLVLAVAGVAVAQSGGEGPGNPPGPRGGPGVGPFFNPPGPRGGRGLGLVGEVVDVGDREFTLLTRGDHEVLVEVTEDTSYLGDLESFADIEEGIIVGVAGHRNGEGSVLARAVASGDRQRGGRARGEVIEVGEDSLTIEIRAGEILTFLVDEATRFHSRTGDVDGLEDIEEGDLALVFYVKTDEGDLLAKAIGVATPPSDQ